MSFSDPGFPVTPAADANSAVDLLSQPPSYHSEYYIQDGMTEFLVENRLFRVDSHFLIRESEKLRSIIMRPREAGDSTIALSGVTCAEFESLMDFFYHGMHDDFDLTLAEWSAVLAIATHFDMAKIRERAIAEIGRSAETLDPVDKILLAKKYGVEAWLAPAYVVLCRRENALEESEAQRLGLETTVKMFQAREKSLRTKPPLTPVEPSLSPRDQPGSSSGGWGIGTWDPTIDFGGAVPAISENHRVLAVVNSIFYPAKDPEIQPPPSVGRKSKVGGKKGGKSRSAVAE
ncbi:hypothetical protein PLICRDRAFT_173450 [Plicaturopsis crispa FD-325 SS-3]|nr:hypothetical protein PLICRDRAFT_173450 [Plicaturopsis crispa FD-325 SS-3]